MAAISRGLRATPPERGNREHDPGRGRSALCRKHSANSFATCYTNQLAPILSPAAGSGRFPLRTWGVALAHPLAYRLAPPPLGTGNARCPTSREKVPSCSRWLGAGASPKRNRSRRDRSASTGGGLSDNSSSVPPDCHSTTGHRPNTKWATKSHQQPQLSILRIHRFRSSESSGCCGTGPPLFRHVFSLQGVCQILFSENPVFKSEIVIR